MLISKGPGNFPRWCFMSLPKVPVGKIMGSLLIVILLVEKLRSNGEVTWVLKGFSGTHWML